MTTKELQKIKDTANEMQDLGCVWTQLGWINEKSLIAANAFIGTLSDPSEATVRISPGYGLEVTYFSTAYGWGNKASVSRVF